MRIHRFMYVWQDTPCSTTRGCVLFSRQWKASRQRLLSQLQSLTQQNCPPQAQTPACRACWVESTLARVGLNGFCYLLKPIQNVILLWNTKVNGPYFMSSQRRRKNPNFGKIKTMWFLELWIQENINPLNAELNPICYLLALLAQNFLHVSRISFKSLTLRLLMSYIYGAHILDVSRSHTTTHHSR